jgi:hypothetical protein
VCALLESGKVDASDFAHWVRFLLLWAVNRVAWKSHRMWLWPGMTETTWCCG